MFEGERIDKNIPVPMYYQLKQILLKSIKSGQTKLGEHIPTEAELMQQFEVSRATVRQAIVELAREGYLERIKGKGTFVCKPKISQDFMQKLEPYKQQMERLNLTGKTKVLFLGWDSANAEAAERFGIAENAPIIRLDRVRYANDEPLVFVRTYLENRCSFILGRDFSHCSLYESLDEKAETSIVRVERQFEAICAGKIEAKLLEVSEGSAIQLVKTQGFSSEDKTIEFSIAQYVGSKNRFSVTLKR